MKSVTLILVCVLAIGCANLSPKQMSASGDSSATEFSCEKATFNEDKVMLSCEGYHEKTVVGGAGSSKLYEAILGIASLMLSGISIAVQVLK